MITIHDAIAERFPELTLPSPRARLFWRMKVALALKQARLVLTPSNYSGRELSEVLGVPEGRIRVAGEAPASAFRPSECVGQIAAAASRLGLPKAAQWFAYVGGFNPHKNVDVIVRAHASIAAECPTGEAPYLVLVGATTGDVFHGDLARIREAIARSGTDNLVRWAGWVADDELRHLLTGASALVLPSESEGFGLPAVEAAACGTPVIATVASPLPELLEGGGIFVEPRDEVALTNAMRALFSDRGARHALGARARERAQNLTWERGAAAALGALREAAA
ncbi:MAG: glycosyltransferase family 4 protein [Gemmatimonadaceae bacterium]